MPSSYVDSFAPIVKLLIEIDPRRVLDIGPGWGKYGLACREYLPHLERLIAIEVSAGRLPVQEAIYDRVYIGDVREHPLLTAPASRRGFDVVLLIDVIEHMPKEDGHALLKVIRGAGCRAVVATPKVFVEQHDPHNPHEQHVCLWEWEDFAQHEIRADVSTVDAIIYLLGRPQ